MKKVKKRHQHKRSTNDPSIQSNQQVMDSNDQKTLPKNKPEDLVELEKCDQAAASANSFDLDAKIEDSLKSEKSKSLEQTILESILDQDNQYEINSQEDKIDDLDKMLDAYDQMESSKSLKEESLPKLQRSKRHQDHEQSKNQKRSFQERLENIRQSILYWSQYPIFTTFIGRFTIISLLACSGFALLLTVLLAGCHQDFELTNQTFVMELGTDIYANPALYINDVDQIDVSKLSVEPQTPGITVLENRFVSVSLDYLGVGTYDFVMKEGREEMPFVIKVKDTKPPTLQATPSEVTVEWGQQPDWQTLYGGTDLSGVYYETNQNIWTEAGTHDIEVKIRDRFGNSLTRSLKVTVKP